MLDKAKTTIAANAPATVTTAVDDLRKSIADLSYDESRATAMSSLSGFGEDASSQAIRSYLEKAMNNVDTIVKGTDTPPTTPTTTPTTTAPAPSGGDDDGPDFGYKDRDTGIKIKTDDVTIKDRTDSSGKKAGDVGYKSKLKERKEKEKAIKEGQKAGKGYEGGYGFKKGGLASRKKKK